MTENNYRPNDKDLFSVNINFSNKNIISVFFLTENKANLRYYFIPIICKVIVIIINHNDTMVLIGNEIKVTFIKKLFHKELIIIKPVN